MSQRRVERQGLRCILVTAAFVVLIVDAGCGRKVDPPHSEAHDNTSGSATVSSNQTSPSEPQPSVPAVEAVTVHDESPPLPSGASHAPGEPLDLAPAIEDTKQVFRDHGLPVDWYASLTDTQPGTEGSHSLFVTGIWTMVGSDVTTRFQQRFSTRRSPTGRLYFGAVATGNPVFEEVMLLALIGPDHVHTKFVEVRVARFLDLPNVDPKFLKPDGAVNFVAIRDAFATQFKQDPSPRAVNDELSVASDADEFCHVVGEWQVPVGDLPAWGLEQLAWRPVIRVEFVDGSRKIPNYVINGNRRLAVGSYVQIGYRSDDTQQYAQIHYAGPFHETAYQPVGMAQVGLAGWKLAWGSRPCKENFVYGELESLNGELSPEDREAAAREADETPVAELPNLTSVGHRPDITALHQELHDLLAPGSAPVPVLPVEVPANSSDVN